MSVRFLLPMLMMLAHAGVCAQTQDFYVRPNQTDARYAEQDSNYIVRNTSARNGRLLLFIGGSSSSPKSYSLICRYAATAGFDVISLSYPNDVAAAPLGVSADSLVFDGYREEVCFGTPASEHVDVDTLNSIHTRTLKLIRYLAETYPAQGWGEYLAAPDRLDWGRIAVGGHSQGSGHACYLGKRFAVERVLMFSGPNDYSTRYDRPGHWLAAPGATPVQRQYCYLHLQDEAVPFARQLANNASVGLLAANDTVLVDALGAPYEGSHALYTNQMPLVPGQYHNSTVGGNPINRDVWRYMLGADDASGVTPVDAEAKVDAVQLRCAPNPARGGATITCATDRAGHVTLSLFDRLGCEVLRILDDALPPGEHVARIDAGTLPAGTYWCRLRAAGRVDACGIVVAR